MSKRLILAMSFLLMAHWPTLAGAAEKTEHPGAKIFRETRCTVCHGEDGSANTKAGKLVNARDLRSEMVRKFSDEELRTIVAKGRGKMPSFEATLKPAQIRLVVEYVRTFGEQKAEK